MPRRTSLHSIIVLLGLAAASVPCRAQQSGTWDFVVRLDDRPVGTHRFVLESDGADGMRLLSDARFDVKLLGVTVYSYRHRSRETWRGGCLSTIDATTDDGGKHAQVRGRLNNGTFQLEGSPDSVKGCLMTFAYWNARLQEQSRLLDPGSGRIEPVRVERLPGREAWRISGLPNPIEIAWEAGRWASLDTVVGGRRLTYRLQ